MVYRRREKDGGIGGCESERRSGGHGFVLCVGFGSFEENKNSYKEWI